MPFRGIGKISHLSYKSLMENEINYYDNSIKVINNRNKLIRNKEKINDLYVNDIIENDLLNLKSNFIGIFKLHSMEWHFDKFLYWVSAIFFVNVTDKRYKNLDKYVQLHHRAMRDVCGDYYEKVKNFLIAFNFIETDSHYKVGRKSLGYRLTEKYRNLAKEGKLKFKIRKTYLNTQKHRIDIDDDASKYIYDNLKNVTIDKEKAEKLIELSKEKKNPSIEAIENYKFVVDALVNKQLYNIRSKKCGRIFNNITNLPSFLRGTIKLNDRFLFSLDIKSCQPLLLLTIYGNKGKEYKKYKEFVEKGDFYKEICRFLDWDYNENTKDLIKAATWSYAFSPNGRVYSGDVEKIRSFFESEYPELNKFIYNFKIRLSKDEHKPHARLPIHLQKMESTAILDYVVIEAKKLGIPLLTIHDSFLCYKENVDILRKLTVKTFKKLFKVKVRMQEEDLQEKHNVWLNVLPPHEEKVVDNITMSR